MRNNRLKQILMLALLTLMVTALAINVSAVTVYDTETFPGGRTIEFLGRECYDNGSSKWTYRVNSTDPAISHWILFWCHGDSVLDTSLGTSYPYEYGLDGDTDYYGMKFNYEFGTNESKTFWFVLGPNAYGECYAIGETQVVIKTGGGPGGSVYEGSILGPVFTFSGTLEASIVGEGFGSTYMVANTTYDYPDATVTFRWWGPYNKTTKPTLCETPTTEPNRTETHVGLPYSDQYGPLIEDDLGWWYVEVEFETVDTGSKSPSHDRSACAEVDVTYVPWFTSLPLVILATIGLLVYLKKKPLKLRA